MIGLKRQTVRIVDHNPYWAELGAETCRRVREAAGTLIIDVQHVGSTSVPGLPAKPILDIAAAVPALDVISELKEKLAVLGYRYHSDEQDSGGHFFTRDVPPDIRIVHLHVVTSDDVQWTNFLRFRDILRQDCGLRKRYAELKHDLCDRYPRNREAYTDAKQDFIQGVLNGKRDDDF